MGSEDMNVTAARPGRSPIASRCREERIKIVFDPPERFRLIKAVAKGVIVMIAAIAASLLLTMLWGPFIETPFRFSLMAVQGMVLGAIAYNIGFLWITK